MSGKPIISRIASNHYDEILVFYCREEYEEDNKNSRENNCWH
jgi:hypothetical protein